MKTLKAARWAFIGSFIGTTIYKIYDYISKPELYAIQPVPWYSGILVNAVFTVLVAALLLAIGRFLNKRSK